VSKDSEHDAVPDRPALPIVRTGLGQKSHRFLPPESSKYCVIGGVFFEDVPALAAGSDGDVVLHALCDAITSLTGVPILGGIAKDLCEKDGITDSQVYLQAALETLGSQQISHVAICLEAKAPRFESRLLEMRATVARILRIQIEQVGITAHSGDGLTDVGCGEGVDALALITTMEWPIARR
jgi:2-C-methyl-D-erythritol 2,4-cyclodiphosphate synthase